MPTLIKPATWLAVKLSTNSEKVFPVAGSTPTVTLSAPAIDSSGSRAAAAPTVPLKKTLASAEVSTRLNSPFTAPSVISPVPPLIVVSASITIGPAVVKPFAL